MVSGGMQKPTKQDYGQIKDGIRPVRSQGGDAPAPVQTNRGASAGLGGQAPLKLILENIGPIKNAEIELGRVTVLYGPNAAGKTTVARAIEYAIKLMNSIGVDCSKLTELVNYGAKVGRIVLNDYEISLERSEDFEKVSVTVKRGAETLHSGECRVGNYLTGLHIASDLGVDFLVWVRYDNVKIVGLESEDIYNLTDLFRVSQIGKYLSKSPVKIADNYDRYKTDINHDLSLVVNGWLDVQDTELFFNDYDNFYKLDHVADGIKRVALIIAAKHIAERMRELGRSPVVFIENFEFPLHIDYIRSLLGVLEKGNVPTILETHSGYVLKYAVTNKWRAYVIEDGSAYTDLTRPELFKAERAVVSELAGIL
jgi:energy-coupling factor transporter ATP-binding protein EcfA2